MNERNKKVCKSMQIGLLQRINNVEQADKYQISSYICKASQKTPIITDINQENSCLMKEHRLKKKALRMEAFLKKMLNDDEKYYCIIILRFCYTSKCFLRK